MITRTDSITIRSLDIFSTVLILIGAISISYFPDTNNLEVYGLRALAILAVAKSVYVWNVYRTYND